jgi:hypothetical protein
VITTEFAAHKDLVPKQLKKLPNCGTGGKGNNTMTRRYIVFFDDVTSFYYSTPEFNGDKSEMKGTRSMDSCEKDWPEIIREFEDVDTLEKFKAASVKAQSYYHSCLGDYTFPVTYTGFVHEGAKKIRHNLWEVEA